MGNEEMVECLLASRYADGRVAEAMRKIPRELFVPAAFRGQAYADRPLPIGQNQTISAPSVVAFMSKELDVREGMRVLEVGAGSGWQAALLSFLAGESGKVVSIERIPELAELARANISKAGMNVEVVCCDGTMGHPQAAPYDRIMVTAAAPKIPQPLVGQLKDGGKLIIPVGGSYWQELVLVEKKNGKTTEKNIMSVVFVPLIGEHGHKE